MGVRGIARDLSAAGAGTLKISKKSNLKYRGNQSINVTIKKEKVQGCEHLEVV